MLSPDRWTARLSEYLDGEMPLSDRQELDQHLRACSECRSALEGIEGVRAWARSFTPASGATDSGPGAGWDALEARLRPTARVNRGGARRALRAGLAIGVAAVLALILFRGPHDTSSVGTRGPAASAEVASESPGESSDGVDSLGLALAAAERSFEVARRELDPEVARVVADAVAEVERTVETVARALEEAPGNRLLLGLLERARGQKLRLLRGAVRT